MSRRDNGACPPRLPRMRADPKRKRDNTLFDSSSRLPEIRAALPVPGALEKTATSGALDLSAENRKETGTVPRHKTSLRRLERWHRYQMFPKVGQLAQFQPTTHPAAACCRNRRSGLLRKTLPWVTPTSVI